MKQVLVISGSPRINGNSDRLCDMFMKGALEAGNTVEKISLQKQNIHYCTGCYACSALQGNCVQQDDMQTIIEKLLAADVIVLATPVYFYCMSAQMKTFIDRCVSCYTAIQHKDFYLIMTAAEQDMHACEGTLKGLRGYLECLDNVVEKGVIYGLGAWQIGDIDKMPAIAEAYTMGKAI